MLVLLDLACFFFHTLLILFNLIGWAFRKTRVAHLVTLSLTLFSWFVMGAYYGWGYCLCADWQFQIRRQLGYVDVETSYLQLLGRQVFGLTFNRSVSDWIAGGALALIVIATAIAWFRQLCQGKVT
jgi:hypothetical protein